MDLGELDLEGIEKACIEKYKGYVPQEQVILLKEAILKAKIKKWNKEEFGNIFLEKGRLEVRLQEIQAIGTNEGYSMALKEEERILESLEEREKQEEILWWQKPRIRWL